MKVKIKKFKDSVKLPSYALAGDAGLDLFSLEELELKPGERHNFKLGFALEIPLGNVGIIKDKSGLSHFVGIAFGKNKAISRHLSYFGRTYFAS